MTCDMPSEVSNYLVLINRGGLKLHTEFVVTLCTNTSILFREIMNKHEEFFLSSLTQKNTLMSLSLIYNRFFLSV